MTKACKVCGLTKEISCFYKRKDGYYRYCCNDCVNEDGKRRREKRTQAERDKIRIKMADYIDRYKEKHRLSVRRWIIKNGDKVKAHIEVNKKIKNGSIKKQPCEICGNQRVNAHHSDYGKPLLVSWLCPYHHKLEHLKRKRLS